MQTSPKDKQFVLVVMVPFLVGVCYLTLKLNINIGHGTISLEMMAVTVKFVPCVLSSLDSMLGGERKWSDHTKGTTVSYRSHPGLLLA